MDRPWRTDTRRNEGIEFARIHANDIVAVIVRSAVEEHAHTLVRVNRWAAGTKSLRPALVHHAQQCGRRLPYILVQTQHGRTFNHDHQKRYVHRRPSDVPRHAGGRWLTLRSVRSSLVVRSLLERAGRPFVPASSKIWYIIVSSGGNLFDGDRFVMDAKVR